MSKDNTGLAIMSLTEDMNAMPTTKKPRRRRGRGIRRGFTIQFKIDCARQVLNGTKTVHDFIDPERGEPVFYGNVENWVHEYKAGKFKTVKDLGAFSVTNPFTVKRKKVKAASPFSTAAAAASPDTLRKALKTLPPEQLTELLLATLQRAHKSELQEERLKNEHPSLTEPLLNDQSKKKRRSK